MNKDHFNYLDLLIIFFIINYFIFFNYIIHFYILFHSIFYIAIYCVYVLNINESKDIQLFHVDFKCCCLW